MTSDPRPIILVTGPSGAGRTTAASVLEDLGFETIGNIPLGLVPQLLDGPPRPAPLVLGIDVRNRDFSVAALLELRDRLALRGDLEVELVYLDCRPDALLRRFNETRRRHPLAPESGPEEGVEEELQILEPIRLAADRVLDTTELTPHDLRERLRALYGAPGARGLTLSVMSFSYKRGLPQVADMVIDCRFLANPHWVPALRARTGLDDAVAAHVAADPRCAPFLERIAALLDLALPAHQDEGKSHFTLALGCTGGQHRSVALAEKLGAGLAEAGWRVSIRHRELERRTASDGAAGDKPGDGKA